MKNFNSFPILVGGKISENNDKHYIFSPYLSSILIKSRSPKNNYFSIGSSTSASYVLLIEETSKPNSCIYSLLNILFKLLIKFRFLFAFC